MKSSNRITGPAELMCKHCNGTGVDMNDRPCDACDGQGWFEDDAEEMLSIEDFCDAYEHNNP